MVGKSVSLLNRLAKPQGIGLDTPQTRRIIAPHPDHGLEGKCRDPVDDFEHIFERDRVHVASPSGGVAGKCGQHSRRFVGTHNDEVRVVWAPDTLQ